MIKTITKDDIYSMIKKKEPPRNYVAFLYQIDVLEENKTIWKHYIGWRKGQIEDIEQLKYFHSSKNKDFLAATENAQKVVYNILDYGTEIEMATLENKMCSDVDAQNNPLYYNNSNGGGRYCHNVDSSNYETAFQIFKNCQEGKYQTRFFPKSELDNLIKRGSVIQVRTDQFNLAHIKILREKMINKRPDDFDPIHVLLPKNENGLPLIIGGNHSSLAVIKVPTMAGLNGIQIPFKEWSKLNSTALELLGKYFNKEPEKPKLSNTLDDVARWVVDTIEECSLYKNPNALPVAEPEPWFNHPLIVTALENMGYGPTQRGEITKKAMVIWDNNRLLKQGDNFLNFSDASLEENPRLSLWLNNKINAIHHERNVDKVIKISAANILWPAIQKATYEYDENQNVLYVPKKVIVLVFSPKLNYRARNDWKKSINTFMYDYENGIKNIMNIEFQYLPEKASDINLPVINEDES